MCMDTGTDMAEEATRPLIAIDDLVREMTEEEHAHYLHMTSEPTPLMIQQAEENAN